MRYFEIKGGAPLEGTVRVQGAKNATTKLLVASLISDQPCVFNNVPNIGDVEITLDLCRELGSQINWDKKNKRIEIVTKKLKTSYIPQRFSGANRIPILMIGALLGRTGEDIIVPTAGGDRIGLRPVNLHISALETLGAKIESRMMKKEGAYFAQAHQGLHGGVIHLSYPSVGATENTILAAVRAKGNTTIKNAAVEPEIIELLLFLQKLGAIISLDTDRTIHIQGTEKFYPVEHTIMSDRIEAASYAIAAISTKGRIFIEGAQHIHMTTFLNRIRELGGGFNVKQNGIEFFYQGKLNGGMHLETDVHPGFMTDWQQPFAVLLTQTEGSSAIHETVYENRFGYIEMLRKMGAEIELFRQCLGGKACRFATRNYLHSAVIRGGTPLKGCDIEIPDLRAGFAYVLAALLAQGSSKIYGVEMVERGYDSFVEKLTSLGANIKVVDTKKSKKLQPA
ncbi:MAG: UDP-N-acetylglucosamine 1-carboxyvinyltransferase 1 [Chlamydiae bacterium]|nr:UDP-N-acetylglucosamine 1-carboxyvinyltransferase 1 [Chlamydiota bacterium]